MADFKEIHVVIKDERRNLRYKHDCYEDVRLSNDCPVLKEMVEKSIEEFKGEPDEIVVKATYFWR